MILSAIINAISSMFFWLLHANSVGSFKKALSKEEEAELLARLKKGDTDAKNKLIEHNLRLVAHITKKYYSATSDADDLISIGTIGLIKAVSTFDESKGIKLATYASRCIENEILMYFRSAKKTERDVSINEPIDTDKDGNALTLIDVIADDYNMYEDVDMRIRAAKLPSLIASCLDGREKEIISLRYGLNGKAELAQRDVAKRLGISRSYVSRIETRALEKLKNAFGED